MITVGFLELSDLSAVKQLVYEYRFNFYRKFSGVQSQQKYLYCFESVKSSLVKDKVLFVKDKGVLRGICVFEWLDWDSKHFGLEMARIKHFIFSEAKEILIYKRKLIEFLIKICIQEGVKHLSFKIDPEDSSGIEVLENNKFELKDTIVSYISLTREKIPHLKTLYPVCSFKPEYEKDLLLIAEKTFWFNRFYSDRNIPHDKALSFYREWVKGCFRKDMADDIFVALKKEKAVGFFTYKMDKELYTYTGIRALGRGVSVVSKYAPGAYINLLEAALRKGMCELRVDFGVFETQIWNYPVIRAYQRYGLKFVACRHTFHRSFC